MPGLGELRAAQALMRAAQNARGGRSLSYEFWVDGNNVAWVTMRDGNGGNFERTVELGPANTPEKQGWRWWYTQMVT